MSQQINLFNPIFLKQKKYFSAVAMAQALGLILAGSLLLAGYAYLQAESVANVAVATSVRLKGAQDQLLKVSAEYGQKPKSQALEDEIQRAESEVQALKKVFAILAKGEFGNTQGYSEYFRGFARQSLDGLWLTDLLIVGSGNEIGVQGRVLQPELVPAYIGRLKREPIMQGKSFSSLEIQMAELAQPGRAPAAAGAGAQKRFASYLEFNLQSSADPKDRETTGAKPK